jgi:hypothetical protein
LKKLIQKALEDTNWRLMSEGISYRLGYLKGRLRAYESEEDLKKLVLQKAKKQPDQAPKFEYRDVRDFKGLDLRDSAQLYFQNITYGTEIIEDGEPFPDHVSTMSAELHPNLRVVIPLKKGDDSIPKFVRNYDFKFGDGKHIPKVQKVSRGRKIRRTD